MKNKFWLGIFVSLLAALILAACGAEQGDALEEPPPSEDSQTVDETTGGTTESDMKPALEQVNDGTYRYSLINETGEPHTFNFTSSQRYDFSLANESGEEVFLFSSVSTYMQALGEENLEPGNQLSYEFEIPALDLEPGTYELTAWLTPRQGETYEVSTEHVVE